jgi:Zn-dependent protease
MHTLLDVAFTDPVYYATIVFALIASIVLHELGHALVASWEGDATPKIRGHLTWNPVVHMGWISIILIAVMGIGWGQTPVNPRFFRHRRWGSVLVSFAGPAVNLFLAFVGALVLVVAAKFGGLTESGFALRFWSVVLHFNVLLFLFNMIPIPPLDGFSVLDGTFDLGNLGASVRQLGMLAFVVAILIVNSDAFSAVQNGAVKGLLDVAATCVGGVR